MFNFLKKREEKPKESDDKKNNVIIISASCCIPGMDAFDRQAQAIIDQAISETGVSAKITLVPAPTAMVAFPKVINELMAMHSEGKIGVPAILINNEIVSYGVPRIEDMKTALKKFAENNNNNNNNKQ